MINKEISIKDLQILKNLLNDVDIEVKGPCGYFKILAYDITASDSNYYTIKTNSGKILSTSSNHLIKNDLGNFSKLIDIINSKDLYIKTIDGLEKIDSISTNVNKKEDLVDIQVEGLGQYYANDIVVHNSNILNSITYGLYGTTFDTLKKEKNRDNKFINNNNKKDYSEVSLIIEINGDDYIIRRRTERKWNKTHDDLTGCSTKTYFNKLDQNGEIIDENNLSDQDKINTQKVIEQSIGDFDEFITKSLINADTLNDILTTDHSKFLDSVLRDTGLDIFEKKLNVFKDYKKNEYKKESLLNISVDRYNQLIEDAKNYIQDWEDNIDDRNAKISVLNDRISNGEIHIENTIKSLKPIDNSLTKLNINDVKDNINKLITDKSDKQNSETELFNQIKKLKHFKLDEELYNSLKEKTNSFNDWVMAKNSQVKELNKENNSLVDEISILNGKIHKENITLSKIEASIETDKRIIEKEIASLENSKICPTCNREKDKNAIVTIKEKIENLNKEIANKLYEDKYQPTIKECDGIIFELNKIIDDKKLEIENNKLSVKTFEEEINKESIEITKTKEEIAKIDIIIKEIDRRNKIKQEYDNIPTLIENIDLKINALNDKLSNYDINIIYIQENNKIQSKIDKYKDSIQELKEQRNFYKKEINEFDYKIKFSENEIKNYKDTIEKYLEQQRQELIREEYQNCIHREGIPSTLLKKLIPKVNMYLENYSEDIDFNVFFDNDLFFQMCKKENPTVIQNVISGSGMERVFACICLRLALRFMNNRSRPNILLLDELFGKLSERNAMNFINLMSKVKLDIDKILIIEHAYGDIINPDYLIMVDKDENGNSFVELKN